MKHSRHAGRFRRLYGRPITRTKEGVKEFKESAAETQTTLRLRREDSILSHLRNWRAWARPLFNPVSQSQIQQVIGGQAGKSQFCDPVSLPGACLAACLAAMMERLSSTLSRNDFR